MPPWSLMAAIVSAKRHAAGDRPLQEEADDLALAGLDLLADDDAHPVAIGELARLQAAGRAVVVGDGDHVEPDLAGALEDVGHRHHAVLAVVRVHVEVGEQLALLAAAARQRAPPPGHLLVDRLDLGADAFPVVPACPVQAVMRQPPPQIVVVQQRPDGRGEGARVAPPHQQSVHLVADHLVVAGQARRDHAVCRWPSPRAAPMPRSPGRATARRTRRRGGTTRGPPRWTRARGRSRAPANAGGTSRA